jgi:hypothetical protein
VWRSERSDCSLAVEFTSRAFTAPPPHDGRYDFFVERSIDDPVVSESELRNRSAWSMFFIVVVVIVAGLTFYHRPAHTFNLRANEQAWNADVQLVRSTTRGGCSAPTGKLRYVADFGRVASICMTAKSNKRAVSILFIGTSSSMDLAYVSAFPPPPDTCDARLGGSWWQVTNFNDLTMSCPRGFSFTGGG